MNLQIVAIEQPLHRPEVEQALRLNAARNRASDFHGMNTTFVRASIEETFAFLADAGNLQRLTRHGCISRFGHRCRWRCAGAEIDYGIRLRGVPLPWRYAGRRSRGVRAAGSVVVVVQVRHDLDRIFTYRQEALRDVFVHS